MLMPQQIIRNQLRVQAKISNHRLWRNFRNAGVNCSPMRLPQIHALRFQSGDVFLKRIAIALSEQTINFSKVVFILMKTTFY